LAITIAFHGSIHCIAFTQLSGVFVTVCIYSWMYIHYLDISLTHYLKTIISPVLVQIVAYAIAYVFGKMFLTECNAIVACLGYAAIYFGICIGVFEAIRPQAYMTIRNRVVKH
jgi:hypothetical protein